MLKTISTLLLSLLFSTVFAQLKISGRVLDHEGSRPLPEVLIKNTVNNHTHSDDNGYFEIEIKSANDTLYFSKLGFDNKFITPQENKTFYAISLEEKLYILPTVEIKTNQSNDPSEFALVDLKNRPIQNSQDLLRIVPGMFIAQHAGGGKAEQLFIRGFDIDHGTDFKVSVDGMPVNMVSHAHGQGYADLHFVIPELVNAIQYQLGPYEATNGNFATAGAANFETIDKPVSDLAKVEMGAFGYKRGMFIYDISSHHKEDNIGYLAAEVFLNNGPFVNGQNYSRFNLNSKYLFHLRSAQTLQVIFSSFSSKWDASGQIPDRAVLDNQISRWGSIDPSEGGNTSRTNLSIIHTDTYNENSMLKTQFYAVNYGFNLYSNFTFFLNDSVNGDQINQQEQRNILGFESKHHFRKEWGKLQLEQIVGIGMRNDFIKDISLAHNVQRKFLANKTLGNIDEINSFAFISENFSYKNWMLNLGLRFDNINFNWQNKLDSIYQSNVKNASILQPKASLFYKLNNKYQLFIKAGRGFHSNDTRVSTSNTAIQTLPSAWGYDVGFKAKPISNLLLQLNYWQLKSQQEFVYVGDEAIVEIAGSSLRKGFDFLLRAQLMKYLQADFDLNFSNPTLLNVPKEENNIPLAPRITSIGGLSFVPNKKLNISLRYRYMADRPANETNTITAKGYQLLDFISTYNYKKIQFQASITNMLNVKWNEAQFATESRLQHEKESVTEIHYTPGFSFFFKLGMSLNLDFNGQ